MTCHRSTRIPAAEGRDEVAGERNGVGELNPAVLVEVTSASTEAYDHGDKLEHFKQIASVMDILIVSHRAPSIVCWSREDGAWKRTEVLGGQRVELRSIGCSLEVDAIYAALP